MICKNDVKSFDDCKNRKLDSDFDEKHCCFVTVGDVKYCDPLSGDNYNKIKEYKEDQKFEEDDKVEVQCDNSNYIVISLLSLSLIILL